MPLFTTLAHDDMDYQIMPLHSQEENETASIQTPALQKVHRGKKTLVSRSAHGNSAQSQWIRPAWTETPPVRCLRRRPRTSQDASRTTTTINSGPDLAEGQFQTYGRTVWWFSTLTGTQEDRSRAGDPAQGINEFRMPCRPFYLLPTRSPLGHCLP